MTHFTAFHDPLENKRVKFYLVLITLYFPNYVVYFSKNRHNQIDLIFKNMA